jgi:phage replication-related protein YjqB (UPF0714/DUF867 family)
MGRGRAKAKQTKVARDLKYFSPNTDLTALQRELTGASPQEPVDQKPSEDEEGEDEYGRWMSGER